MSPFCQGLKASDQRPIYDLYGVANHHGLLIGGHYTSYVRLASDGTPGSSEIGKYFVFNDIIKVKHDVQH